jgi:hypothetical protein
VRDGLPSCACNVTGPPLAVSCAPGATPVSSSCAYPDQKLNYDKLVVYEPMAVRNQLDISTQISRPFTEYPNTVFAPHTYTHSFTLWKQEPYWIALATATREAAAMRSAVLVTEWGGSSIDELRGIATQQMAHLTNSMHWVWKQNDEGGWSVHSATAGSNFTIRMDRLRATSTVYPRATAGELLTYSTSLITNQSFHMSARCPNNQTELLTEVYMPAHAAGSCANRTTVSGSASLYQLVRATDGSVVAEVACEAPGGVFEVGC